jgi:hypothetical protein
MKFVISGAFQPPRDLVPIAQAAEESGFEGISFCAGARCEVARGLLLRIQGASRHARDDFGPAGSGAGFRYASRPEKFV